MEMFWDVSKVVVPKRCVCFLMKCVPRNRFLFLLKDFRPHVSIHDFFSGKITAYTDIKLSHIGQEMITDAKIIIIPSMVST